jgi:uncharacterized Ntn-hydrolase superfamily protein
VTFSVAARCGRTGAFGVAVSSSSPAVASRCAYVRAGVGAACSQNITDPRLGPRLLGRLAEGRRAEQAVADVVDGEPNIEYRQLTAVGADGVPAAYSGARTLGRYGSVCGADVVAAGNMLRNEEVLPAAAESFEDTPEWEIADRLLSALGAALAAGGEEGPVHSAGLLIATDVPWPVTDLRVDWTEGDPVAELTRLWELWRPQQADYRIRGLDPTVAPSYGVPGDP